MKIATITFALLLSLFAMSQTKTEKLPYYQIPEYPENYTAGTVGARMVDGLGFRYYWATESLRDEDLNYKASESGRTSAEIVDHIYGLSKFIRNNVLVKNKDKNKDELNFEEKRKQTLINFKTVSDVLRDEKKPFDFEETDVPFWNVINGPIADALWHCGQLVMLRRASGNPFNSRVSVFNGKLKK